ncbi:tyrosine-protein phosphatase [Actinoplanes teichomyceticus]|uniref:Tyrosine phosphatase family protein n=1 Tax=Actinoplanes teichomyceticus TaxID=1867 RepID=A0A561WLN1_ACTTI|nr:tyrosine-protein phosphatase [Actinoplanes teichomyceticus]TWG24771.1 tyrosine phosphatase family protein [Actinoplanes teichomyceticus]
MNLDWPDCKNARDLGGLPTAEGGRVRPGALIRSDSHGRLTPDAVRAIRALGVARILDLRSSRECAADPSPFSGDPSYRHVPLLADPMGYDPPADTYGPMLDHNTVRIAHAFREIASAPPGGLLVHCRSGRDRTGALVALLLAVAGVAPEDIASDFAQTPGTSSDAMRNTLMHATTRYGGVPAYLTYCGVPATDLTAIRERLTVRPS